MDIPTYLASQARKKAQEDGEPEDTTSYIRTQQVADRIEQYTRTYSIIVVLTDLDIQLVSDETLRWKLLIFSRNVVE